jgi:tRNA(Ile)-lysidine synthase
MKKVSDFFIDEKVPLHERWNTLVVEDAGRIVWLIGRRLDERFRVQPETGKCVKFQVIWTEEHELSESKTGS